MKWKGEKDLRSQLVPIGKLKEDPRNARLHDDRNIEAIRVSLDSYGQQKAVVCRKGILVAGSGTLRAARALGWTHLAAVQTSLSEADATAFAIADNRTAELATWDPKALSRNLLELAQHGVDAAHALAIKPDELKEMLAKFERENPVAVTEDEVPEPPKVARSRAGEVIILGKHRLMCGDATKPEDVTRLMDGEKADMVFTDPPYGANISGMMQDVLAGGNKYINRTRRWEQIKGDEHEDVDLQAFLEKAFRNAAAASKENAPWYIWHAMPTQGFFAAAAAADLLLNRQIIWVKPALILAFGHYHWKHELCFYGWRRGHEPKFYGPKNETTVWEMDYDGHGRTPKVDRQHPTQKPVSLGARAIKNSSAPGEIVLDLFGGSGSTLIAAEQLGRRAFLMELDPKYCDVIVARWENLTGKKSSRGRGGE